MKNFYAILISLVVVGAWSNIASAVEFTPLNFSDATYTSSTTKIASNDTTQNTDVLRDATPITTNSTGSKNMQSAISKLDNAQVEVRNELLNYKTKFSEVDAQYNKVKSERTALSKQIKACEKKISQLDKAKEKIRKNMQ